MVYLVTYDLKSPNDTSVDYTRVISAIKALYPVWCHLEESVWLVSSSADSASIRESLKPYLYDKDVLFVARLSGGWAARNLDRAQVNWLQSTQF